MSFVFEIDGVTVWSPALRVGDAYQHTAKGLGASLAIEPGFTDISSDMIDIDVEAFSSFVRQLMAKAEESEDQTAW